MKVCTDCNINLPRDYFYPRGKYVSAKCKVCTCQGLKDKRKEVYIPSKNELLLVDGKRECTCCLLVKDTSEFYRKRDSFDSWCKPCKALKKAELFTNSPDAKLKASEQSKEYRQRPEVKYKRKAYSAQYYQDNREEHAAWVKAWYFRNPGKNYEYSTRWRVANLDVSAYFANKRYTNKLQATPSWAKDEELMIREMYKKSKEMQELTSIKHHVDHIVPLQSDFVCGLHCIANLRVIPAFENISKSNKYWPDMW